MRNLKKVLALVLALVMTMSLVTIANAAEFTDEKNIQYNEAVEVMSTLGVLDGFEDGSFKPEGTLTREQAAKIITVMLLGDNAEKLGASTSAFSDVAATRWSAPYINYCASTGIIAGNGNGTFTPSSNLTGYAFAKMLLGALGYKADVEGFVGAGWTLKVAAMAAKTGLLNDIKDFAGNNEISREQAAQMALNTLKATMVVYDGTTIDVTTGESTVTIGNTSYSYVTSNNSKINCNISDDPAGNSAEYFTLEFGEQHYPDLVYNKGQVDDFGRPSNEWVFKKLSIGVYPVAADFEYTTLVARSSDKDDSKEKDLGLRNYKLYNERTETSGNVDLYVNGRRYNNAITSVGQIADYTDNGTLVQLYTSDSRANTIIAVVVVKSQMMQVKTVGSDYVSLKDVDDHTDIVGNGNNAFNQNLLKVDVSNVKEGDEGYTVLSGLKANDLVVVIPVTTNSGSSYSVSAVYVPETVVGKLSSVGNYNSDAVSVTVGGTAYDISLWNDDFAGLDADAIAATQKDVTLYLDAYGNAMKIKDAGATSSYMVVADQYQSLVDGRLVTMLKGFDVNGTELTLNVGTSFGGGIDNGELVKYTNANTSSHAEYRIEDATTTTNPAKIYSVAAASSSDDIKASDAKINLTGAGYTWVAKNIKFIYVTYDNDGTVESIEIKNGVQATTYTELQVNGGKTYGAQAYLNGSNAVAAVVIKQESNDAVSSQMMYIKEQKSAESVDGTSNKKVYTYTVEMMSADGPVEERTISSYDKVSKDSFVKYAETTVEGYENFYNLSAYNQQMRTTSTVQATITSVQSVNEALAMLDGTAVYDMNNVLLDNSPSTEVNLIRSLGGGDVQNQIRLLDAEWVDLSGNDISNINDLADISAKNNVKVSLIVNDNDTSNGFRNVAMIVITGITAKPVASSAPVVTSITAGTPSQENGGVVATVVANGSGTLSYAWYKSTDNSNATSANDTLVSAGYSNTTTAALSADAATLTNGTTYYFYCKVTNTETGKTGTTVTSNVVSVTPAAPSQENALDFTSTAAQINEELASAAERGVSTITLNGTITPNGAIKIPADVTFKVNGNFTDANGVTGDGKLEVTGSYTNNHGNIVTDVKADSVELKAVTTLSADVTTGAITGNFPLTVTNTGSVTAASVADDLTTSGTVNLTGDIGGALTVKAGTVTANDVTGAVSVEDGDVTLNDVAGSSTIAVAGGKLTLGATTLTTTGGITMAGGELDASACDISASKLALTAAATATVKTLSFATAKAPVNFAGGVITVVDAISASSANTTTLNAGTWNFTGKFTLDGSQNTTIAADTTVNFNGGIAFTAQDKLLSGGDATSVFTVGDVTSSTHANEDKINGTDGSSAIKGTDIKNLSFKGSNTTEWTQMDV